MQLTEQQRQAFEKFRHLKVGALFMKQGTGKTRLALELIKDTDADLVLFFCPFSTRENLLAEIEKWGIDREYLVTGYETIASSDRVYVDLLQAMQGLRVFVVADEDKYEIVDGFHRYSTMLHHKDIYDREEGCLPVSIIDKPISERMASTIRHNRARGEHDIQLMKNIVAELVEAGCSDRWIMKNIGMEADELLRLKQLSGIGALFKDRDFSKSWVAEFA